MQNLTTLGVIGIILGAVVVTIVVLTGGDSGPKPNILILMDTSAAMTASFEDGTKIEAAVTTINDLIEDLHDSDLDQVALRRYGGPCGGENTELVIPFSEQDENAIRDALANVAVFGGTALVSGIEATTIDFTGLELSGEPRRAIIVAGAGDSCQGNLPENLQRLKEQGVEVTFIGLGITAAQREELTAAATAIDGRIIFVQTQRDLADALSTIISELTEDLGTFFADSTPATAPASAPTSTPIPVASPTQTPTPSPTPVPPPTSDPNVDVGPEPTRTPAPPVINLAGLVKEIIEVGSLYVDAGATASGSLTASIVIDNPVNTTVLGSYTVTYDVTDDSSGKPAIQVTRTVDVVDRTPPVIKLLGLDPDSIEIGMDYTDSGATAFDNFDGSITADIVTAISVDTSALGPYTVTYDVEDASENQAVQVTRNVNVVDTTPPVITVLGLAPEIVEGGSAYVDSGATAIDNVDGDVTAEIATVILVDVAVIAKYTVTYDVKDSSGNQAVQATRTVEVVDTTPPVITMLGLEEVSVNQGTDYVDAGATAFDTLEGDLTASIVAINSVNTAVAGSYAVTYRVTDTSGNPAQQVNRSVIVEAPNAGGKTPSDKAIVTDNTGALKVEIPKTWQDIEGGQHFHHEQVYGVQLIASPGVNGFLFGWEEPGILFVAGSHVAEDDTDEELLDDHFRPGPGCIKTGRSPYNDGKYQGLIDTYVNCPNGASVTVMAASPPQRPFAFVIFVQSITEADVKASQHIFATFTIDSSKVP